MYLVALCLPLVTVRGWASVPLRPRSHWKPLIFSYYAVMRSCENGSKPVKLKRLSPGDRVTLIIISHKWELEPWGWCVVMVVMLLAVMEMMMQWYWHRHNQNTHKLTGGKIPWCRVNEESATWVAGEWLLFHCIVLSGGKKKSVSKLDSSYQPQPSAYYCVCVLWDELPKSKLRAETVRHLPANEIPFSSWIFMCFPETL